MKNQYFGDVRDLFKYDLIENILEGVSPLEKRFTFIPMLTNGESKSGDGNKRDFESASDDGKPGTKNEHLWTFLKKYDKETPREKRNIADIRRCFEAAVDIDIYKGNVLFKHRSRNEYFKEITGVKRSPFLFNPLIFIDPDIGLEVEKSSEKHLLYEEVEKLYDEGMGTDSILMIYQHFPYDRSILKYLPSERAATLEDKLGLKYTPLYISDNEICFLFLTKNDNLRKNLVKILSEYIDKYKLFFSKLKVSNISPDII